MTAPARRRLLAAALPLFARPAAGADGVLEINAACAITGCFAGDAVGFPVTITSPGSYRLTSNLTLTSANTTAISIAADEVELDLGGFRIGGVTRCSGAPLVCTSTGTGIGVTVDLIFDRYGVEVRNGTVIGMGSRGVYVGPSAIVEGLRVGQNGSTGIYAGAASVIADNTAYRNGGEGFQSGSGALLRHNTALQNASNGFVGGAVSFVENSVFGNQSDGILGGDGSVVQRNLVWGNGDAIGEDGIQCGLGCSVQGNAVRLNFAFGMSLGATSAYLENVVTDNQGGTVSGGVNRLGNECAGFGTGVATCP